MTKAKIPAKPTAVPANWSIWRKKKDGIDRPIWVSGHRGKNAFFRRCQNGPFCKSLKDGVPFQDGETAPKPHHRSAFRRSNTSAPSEKCRIAQPAGARRRNPALSKPFGCFGQAHTGITLGLAAARIFAGRLSALAQYPAICAALSTVPFSAPEPANGSCMTENGCQQSVSF